MGFSGCAPDSGGGSEWASGVSDGQSSDEVPSSPETPSEPGEEEPVDSSPIPGLYFSLKEGTTQLAHGPGKTWNGCDSSAFVKGGYDSDTTCGNSLLHPAFASHLNRHFFNCVEDSSRVAGFAKPERIFIRHWGTYVNRNARNSSSLSMHAYARAIDIVKFIIYESSGKAQKISTHLRDFKGATKTFYNAFRQCWRKTMPSSCGPGDREYIGSIGIPESELGGNSLHNDHIHLSYPLCAGSSV